MTDIDPTAYYLARERQERELAQGATDPAVSAIHLEMATRYVELVSAWPARTPDASSLS